ncbi:hypothetical protein PR048_029257 [Dryococelus australis]|uniref:Uncharacterized protein n=1 Tax=Dryococelus australis TaxID=614101 RepID=A0ABQ9GFK1_9NEOP|nr:hypothetical protein PR048_029257 [Dryococelus australis]
MVVEENAVGLAGRIRTQATRLRVGRGGGEKWVGQRRIGHVIRHESAANEQTSETRVNTGLWSLAYGLLNSRNFPIPTNQVNSHCYVLTSTGIRTEKAVHSFVNLPACILLPLVLSLQVVHYGALCSSVSLAVFNCTFVSRNHNKCPKRLEFASNESFTTKCDDEFYGRSFTTLGHFRHQPVEVIIINAQGPARFALLFGFKLEFTVLYILKQASFLDLLLPKMLSRFLSERAVRDWDARFEFAVKPVCRYGRFLIRFHTSLRGRLYRQFDGRSGHLLVVLIDVFVIGQAGSRAAASPPPQTNQNPCQLTAPSRTVLEKTHGGQLFTLSTWNNSTNYTLSDFPGIVKCSPETNRRSDVWRSAETQGAGETGDPRENPPTSGIFRHDLHMLISGRDPPGIEPGSPSVLAYYHDEPGGSLPDFRMWESCHTMPLVGGFARESPLFPPLFHSRTDPYNSMNQQELAKELVVKIRNTRTIYLLYQDFRCVIRPLASYHGEVIPVYFVGGKYDRLTHTSKIASLTRNMVQRCSPISTWLAQPLEHLSQLKCPFPDTHPADRRTSKVVLAHFCTFSVHAAQEPVTTVQPRETGRIPTSHKRAARDP